MEKYVDVKDLDKLPLSFKLLIILGINLYLKEDKEKRKYPLEKLIIKSNLSTDDKKIFLWIANEIIDKNFTK